jgi:hypothetical protein
MAFDTAGILLSTDARARFQAGGLFTACGKLRNAGTRPLASHVVEALVLHTELGSRC